MLASETGEHCDLVPTGEQPVPDGGKPVPTSRELVSTGKELVHIGRELEPTRNITIGNYYQMKGEYY